MAKATAKVSKFEQNREYALYFTMTMSLIYALYWAIVTLTDITRTDTVELFGTVLLGLLMIGGVTMGILYAMHLRKK